MDRYIPYRNKTQAEVCLINARHSCCALSFRGSVSTTRVRQAGLIQFKMSRLSHLCFTEAPADLNEILNCIEEKLDSNGIRHDLLQELAASQLEMNAAKEVWLQNAIVIETIKLLLAEQHSEEPSPKLSGALRTLDSLLSVAELENTLGDVDTDRTRGLELSREDLENAADLNRPDISDRIEEMRFLLLPILEGRFRKSCEGLASFCDHRPGFSFGRTSAVPALIKSKKERLSELKRQNEADLNHHLSMLIAQEQVARSTRSKCRSTLKNECRWS